LEKGILGLLAEEIVVCEGDIIGFHIEVGPGCHLGVKIPVEGVVYELLDRLGEVAELKKGVDEAK
jgi:hypothetical protein